MSASPIIRFPINDATAGITNHQWGEGRCGPFEMRMIDCLEAYGFSLGKTKCELLIKDYTECALRHKEKARYRQMRDERERQYKAGERSKEEHYAPAPRIDSY